MDQLRSIVIIGGGFAGTTLARELDGRLPAGWQLLLISEESYTTFNPLLPAYNIVNLRLGVRHAPWDIAFYVNNLTDERALLALDRERGLLARQGFLTNQPRTFGLTTRVDF